MKYVTLFKVALAILLVSELSYLDRIFKSHSSCSRWKVFLLVIYCLYIELNPTSAQISNWNVCKRRAMMATNYFLRDQKSRNCSLDEDSWYTLTKHEACCCCHSGRFFFSQSILLATFDMYVKSGDWRASVLDTV